MFKEIINIIFALILIAALVFFGAKIYLFLNLLLGNDLIVSASADKDYFLLSNGESDKVRIELHASANPFCTSECVSDFIDLSTGVAIESSSFSMNLFDPQYKEYALNANRKGEGQILYLLELKCRSKATFFCRTTEEEKGRKAIVALDYKLNQEEEKFRDDSKKKIANLFSLSSNQIENLKLLNYSLNEFTNSTSEASILKDAVNTNMQETKVFAADFENLKEIWENQDYDLLKNKLDSTSDKFYSLNQSYKSLDSAVISNISFYNAIINNLTNINLKLNNLRSTNVSAEILSQINSAITRFNTLSSFSKLDSSLNRMSQINKLNLDIKDIYAQLGGLDLSQPLYNSNLLINDFNRAKIALNYSNFSINIKFNEPKKQCCVLGKCEECCNESCKSDPAKYPVILLHGHDFNKGISAESSLDTFTKMQNKLQEEGYIDAGPILIGDLSSENMGTLGEIRKPISIIASYYFDIYKNTKDSIIVQTKADNIDTYAIRLKDVIGTVKYKTNRDRIIIVAHSMGGLVVRRYMQIFGSKDIDRLILIGTPNNGIGGSTRTYCAVFGAKSECEDMDKDSLFINKLNRGWSTDIPIYNIIGLGCDTSGEEGDGIVTKDSANLEGADNFFIQGACPKSFEYLHNDLINPEKYPEVFRIIVDSLKSRDK